MTSRLHNYGAKVGCQLFQAGRYSFSKQTGVQAVSASAVRSPLIMRHEQKTTLRGKTGIQGRALKNDPIGEVLEIEKKRAVHC